mmetsp:Transcript_23757/g.53513  ORF Transcript_23757/g.53513 Transcript_23757/m.53513 type:complete len:330 (+) Transcript_23757:55-1044(+)
MMPVWGLQRMKPGLGITIRGVIALALLQVTASTPLTAEGYADVLGTGSAKDKAVFVEMLVTQRLHGFVTSPEGLQTFAASAPESFDLLLTQLPGQLWLCGGSTGRICDDPLLAPLNDQGWASALRANDTARGILAGRIVRERLRAKVTDEQQLNEWARSAPQSWDAALSQLKEANFTCGGEAYQRCVTSSEGDDGLNAHQKSAVLLGEVAFASLILSVLIVLAISATLVCEDWSKRDERADKIRVAQEKYHAHHGEAAHEPALNSRASSSVAAAPAGLTPVMLYQGAPRAPLLPGPSVRVVTSGQHQGQGMFLISPKSAARADNEPWPV